MSTTAQRLQELIDVRHQVATTGKVVSNEGRSWTLSDLDQLSRLITDEENRLAAEQAGQPRPGGRFRSASFQ